jgi:hypothetical protein
MWLIGLTVLALGGVARAAGPDALFAPLTNNPVTEPLFNSLPQPQPQAPERLAGPLSLFDAATANEPLALPDTTQCLPQPAVGACFPVPDFTTWCSAEWLIGRTRGVSLVPVITTGPASAGALAGAIGQPTSYPLFGGKEVLNDWRSGLRVELGFWSDPDHRSGVSARFYSLFSERQEFTALPNGTEVVNVPHFVPVGSNSVQIPVFVGFPGVATGAATASARTLFTGGDLNYRRLIDRTDSCRLELLVGYRQLYLSDQLAAAFTAVCPNSAPGSRLVGADSLHTRNDFFGPQLGLCASTVWNRFALEGHAATALGVTVSDLDFARSRAINGPGDTAALAPALAGIPGSLPLPFAPNQIPLGATAQTGTLTYFGVVAEGGVRLNWSATDHIRLMSGYSFLFWNDVRRAPDIFTGGSLLRVHTVDSVTHLLSAGLEVRY